MYYQQKQYQYRSCIGYSAARSLDIEAFITKERFTNGRVCPICECIHVVRNGHHKDGTQRYVCKGDGRSRKCIQSLGQY